MSFTRNRRRAPAAALLTWCAFLALAPCALAADPDGPGDTDDGWRKVISYSRCALQVFAAITPAQWSAAFFDCARLFLDEPPLSRGGK